MNLRQPFKVNYGAKSCQIVWEYKNKMIAHANRFCDLRDRCNEIGILYAPFLFGKPCTNGSLLLLSLLLLLLSLTELSIIFCLTTSPLIFVHDCDVMICLL
jgi:hypothetical protein